TAGGIIPFDLPKEDGFIALTFRGSIMFLGSYTDLNPRAVATIMASPIIVGVAKISRGLMFFGLKIPDIYPGWNDMPFSICITPAGLRRISPPDRNGERAFSILLAERRTKTLAAMKPIRMSSRWCGIFDQILEGQEDAIGNYTMANYES